jgi:hypothetical protein
MNREDLHRLALQRSEDARVLLAADCSWGAYYLAGYAVECALKACIAKAIPAHEFPDPAFARSVHIHNLEQLMQLADLKGVLDTDMKANESLRTNWAVVKDWKETSRYDVTHDTKRATDLYRAIHDRPDGILAWIIPRW